MPFEHFFTISDWVGFVFFSLLCFLCCVENHILDEKLLCACDNKVMIPTVWMQSFINVQRFVKRYCVCMRCALHALTQQPQHHHHHPLLSLRPLRPLCNFFWTNTQSSYGFSLLSFVQIQGETYWIFLSMVDDGSFSLRSRRMIIEKEDK